MSKLSERRKQIREYTMNEAEQELERLRRQLFDLRIQQQRGEVKNNRQFTQVRTDIARLMYQLDLLEETEGEGLESEEEVLEEEEAGEGAVAEEGEEDKSAETEEGEEAEEVEEEAERGTEQEEEPEEAAGDGEETDGEAQPARKRKSI